MRRVLLLLVLLLSFSSCSKDSTEICGVIEGGKYDMYSDTFKLRIDGTYHWVDQKTYESYFVGDFICLEDW